MRLVSPASEAGTPDALGTRLAGPGHPGVWKVAPLADWTSDRVWAYIREHDLPYSALHDRGYPSIGCTHCTQPVGPGGSPRDGRWAGVAKTECGIN
jgi:phosphoadenosine phosphosulfate reductase